MRQSQRRRVDDGAVQAAVAAIGDTMSKLDASAAGFGGLMQELRDLATGMQNLVEGVELAGDPPRGRPAGPGRRGNGPFLDITAVLRDRPAAARR